MKYPWLSTVFSALLLSCVLPSDVRARPSDPPTVPADTDARETATVSVGPEARGLVLPWTPEQLEMIQQQRWADLLAAMPAMEANLRGEQRGAAAFVKAFALVRADRAAEAQPHIEKAAGNSSIPPSWIALVQAEAALAAGNNEVVLKALASFSDDHPESERAEVIRAEALRALGRTEEAFAAYVRIVDSGSSTPAVAVARLALAARAGEGSEEAYGHLRRVWADYPKTEWSKQGWPALEAYGREATVEEEVDRAYVLMGNGDWAGVLAEAGMLAMPTSASADTTCRWLYALGRSYYKKNQLSNSISSLKGVGPRCKDASEDWGARSLYLVGRAQFRKKQYLSAAKTFESIPKLYPESSYADDGWTHAGIALQEVGQLDAAQEKWTTALESHPEGDTTPESTWRVAWSSYLEGNTKAAIDAADALGDLPLGTDRRHVEAGRYWSARWRAYPNVDDPRALTQDGDQKAEAVRRWRALCESVPHSYYSIMAYSRLVEVDPEVAAALRKHQAAHDRATDPAIWEVREAFWSQAMVQEGVQLARLGLARQALATWSRAPMSAETPQEWALITELRRTSGDWLAAHAAMRHWLKSHPPGTLGSAEPDVLRVGYPDQYWTEVQAATKPYDSYEGRLFHGLVREESNFNKDIRSFAGAVGLSQLMPATAKTTAGWLKRPTGDLRSPLNNLEIGAKYLDVVVKQLAGSPFLALAGYNAGPHRVEQWLEAWGNVPTDEFVERIPFRETRGYVRRVTTTWQTYRHQFDDAEAFPDMSRFNHYAAPKQD